MLIREWMTKNVITALPETSMMKASKQMKENNIRRLPVVDESGRLVGIVSDRDIKEASPSKATTLDVHELYYLLSEIKVKDIMTKSPRILNQNETVERCAVLMQEKKISSVPIVDDENKVVGIMTDSEVFKLLINITGVYLGGIQLGFKLVDTEGSLKVILDTLKKHNARIISILTAYNRQDEGLRDVYIRIHNMDKADENVLRKELEETYGLSYWVRDTIHPKSIKSMA